MSLDEYIAQRNEYLKTKDPTYHDHRSKNDFDIAYERDFELSNIAVDEHRGHNHRRMHALAIAEVAEGLRIIAKYIHQHTLFLKEKDHREQFEKMGMICPKNNEVNE